MANNTAAAQIDSLKNLSYESYARIGNDYLIYLKTSNVVNYYTLTNPRYAKTLLPHFYSVVQKISDQLPAALSNYFSLTGRIEAQLGNHVAALDNYSLAVDAQLVDYSLTNDKNYLAGIGYILVDIGNVYYSFGMYPLANKFYFEALDYFNRSEYKLGRGLCFNNLGLVHEKLQQYDSAYIWFNKAYILRNQESDPFFRGHSQKYLARIKYEQGKYTEAEELITKCINNISASSLPAYEQTLIEAYLLASKIYLRRCGDAESIKFLALAERLSKKTNDSVSLCDTYYEYAEHFYGSGKYRNALNYAQLASAVCENSIYDQRLRSIFQISRMYTVLNDNRNSLLYMAKYDSMQKAGRTSLLESAVSALHAGINMRQKMFYEQNERQKLHARNRVFLFGGIGILTIIVLLSAIAYYRYFVLKKKERELTESRKKLIELNAVKDRLFSIIGHDLKTPFTALLGYSQTLISDSTKLPIEEVREMTQTIYQLSSETLSLLENLLEWSRIQLKKTEYKPNWEDLYDAIIGTVNLSALATAEKQVEIVLDIKPGIAIYADVFMLNAILRNLLSNAVKFSYPKSKVEIYSKRLASGVDLIVKDYGTGISDERMSSIYNINMSNSSNGTQGERGTGLGLQICREFIDYHHGSLSIKSTQGKGSEFHVLFPLPKGLDAAEKII